MAKRSVAWKNAERQTAAFFGSRRNPGSGAYTHHTRADILHTNFFIEVKQRVTTALWKLYKATRPKAHCEDKVPVIATHQNSCPGFLITVHSSNLPAFISGYLELYGYEIDPNDISPSIKDGNPHPTP